jgi:predicted Fe-Mo cluster-binding NifX family protein
MTLRIAVPIDNGRVFAHFGRSPGFRIYHVDRDENRIRNVEDLPVPPRSECSSAVTHLLAQAVDVVIAAGIGEGASARLAAANVRLYSAGGEEDPDRLVRRLLDDELDRGTATCRDGGAGHHHRCGGGRVDAAGG